MKIERLLIALPFMAGIFLVVVLVNHALSDQADFEHYHAKLTERALNDTRHQMENFLDEYRRSVKIYVSSALSLIQNIYDDVDDDDAVATIEEQLNQFFPHYMAYTITRENGDRLVDFFMESVGEVCQRDVETAFQTGTYPMFIHPGPLEPHIDIIVPWKMRNGSFGMFLVSFKPDILANILKHVQPEGHNLYLLRNDAEGLIEVSADGLRKNLERDAILSVFEQGSIQTKIDVPGTLWTIVDVIDESLLLENRNTLIRHAAFIFILYLIVAGFLTALGLREIKRRKIIEQSLLEAKLNAEQANMAKSMFISNMSHELRTPLNAVIGFSNLMQMDSHLFDEEQNDSINMIHEAGGHLLNLVNDILDLSSIESGDVKIDLQLTEPGPIIDEVISWIKPQAKNRSVSLEVPAKNFGDIMLMADPLRLRQALLNLLSNAVKYNREGGKVYIELEEKGKDRLRISIHDTGKGISEEEMDRLFKPFERLGDKHKGVEGIGIGLVLTKRLVESMGGNIGLDSVPGEGSTFWIELRKLDNPG